MKWGLHASVGDNRCPSVRLGTQSNKLVISGLYPELAWNFGILESGTWMLAQIAKAKLVAITINAIWKNGRILKRTCMFDMSNVNYGACGTLYLDKWFFYYLFHYCPT